jgi:MFS family permease
VKLGSKSAKWVLSVAGFAYLIAVSQRSTLGAASLSATNRFHVSGEQLAILAVAQLAVYAVLQIPVGVLLDRFGSRVLLVFGGIVMAFGQIQVAYATTFQIAAFGRLAVGFGDAFTFISIIRLINGWFDGKHASRLQQWMGNLGQLGQVLSAFGFVWLLQISSWQSAFLTWSSISVVCSCLVFLVVRNDRAGLAYSVAYPRLSQSFRQLLVNVKSPSVRMSFWVHFVIQSPGTVMALLWGMPFLVGVGGV